jgi:Phage tail lysozyme
MTLLDQDWTEEQAQGLLDSLNLDGGTPKWKLEHLRRLRDWCSVNDKDPATVDGQLEFVAYELCNGFQGVGTALKQAKTAEEARQVVEPYARRLRVPERQSEPDRALSSPTTSGLG